MKRTLVSFIYLMLSLTSFSQYFVNPENHWNVDVIFAGVDQPSFYHVTWEYKLDAPVDTNGYTYYQLFSRQDSLQMNWEPNQFYYREENGLVFRTRDLSTEYLTYDFNIDSVNQIIHLEGEFESLDYLVTGIDSVMLLNGEIRRRIKLDGQAIFSGPTE